MNCFRLRITSPDGAFFDGSVQSISLRGTEGEFAVLKGHIPFITSVVPCKVKLVLEDESEKEGTADGGILTVSEEEVVFLSSGFHW